MTTPDVEQRLRDAMRAHADAVPTSGEWDHVRQRASFARRRRRNQRVGLSVLTAAAAVLLAAAVLPGLGSDPSQPVETGPAQPGPQTPAPGPDDTAPPIYVSDADDPAAAAREFGERYLGMTEVFAGDPLLGHDVEGTESAGVAIRAWEQGPITRVDLRRHGDGWGVIGADTDSIVLDAPGAGESIVAPVRLRGAARTFEGTVHVEVREQGMLAGQALGEGFVTGSGGPDLGPFDGEIDFSGSTQAWGAIVLLHSSAEDGSTLEATVVPVAFHDDRAEPEAGSVVYALTADGVVALRASGERVIVAEEHLGQGAGDLALSPDRRTLYFSRLLTGCLAEIVAVPLGDGGEPTGEPDVVTAGTSPAVSPDGRLLAHAVDEECDGHSSLVVRDLATGEIVRQWDDAGTRFDPWSSLTSISWSPDGDRIAYSLQSEHVAEVRVLVIDDGTSVLDGRELAPDRSERADSDVVEWLAPHWDPTTGLLYVVEECCELNVRDEHRVLAVDASRGAPVGEVLATSDRITRVLTDATGLPRLLVVADGLLRLGEARTAEQVATGITDAAW